MSDKANATFRNGQIELDRSVDWPDGVRVEVRLLGRTDSQPCPDGVRPAFFQALMSREPLDESWWPLSAEEMQLLLQVMDKTEPLELSENEIERMETMWREERELQKELARKPPPTTKELQST